ncbi:hypothetical protein [Frankia sp. Cppng1_Ct_nod]|uniref:hypothetical protein n=1 Tax=Frankia sp. Cppng1_Ct_nod TaxID=2897162 RepID=UPI0010414ACA|nr:hypothetical protein [Frankia sp. Cppng1_Ct_nod]
MTESVPYPDPTIGDRKTGHPRMDLLNRPGWNIAAARACAHPLLAPLAHRWAHSQARAGQARAVAYTVPPAARELRVVAASPPTPGKALVVTGTAPGMALPGSTAVRPLP